MYWKRIFTLLLAAFMALSVLTIGASASGTVYSTDIMAYVDGHPIPSYNIGGRTCICVEDLAYFGFAVSYDDPSRTLKASYYRNDGNYIYDGLERGTPGGVNGKIYSTDIRTYINGHEVVETYNIGGRTCVCIEEIATDIHYDFRSLNYKSKYGLCYRWDAENRAIILVSGLNTAPGGVGWRVETPRAEAPEYDYSYGGFSLSCEVEGDEAKLVSYGGDLEYFDNFSFGGSYSRGYELSFETVSYCYGGDGRFNSRLGKCVSVGYQTEGEFLRDPRGVLDELNSYVVCEINGEPVKAAGVVTRRAVNSSAWTIFFDKLYYLGDEVNTFTISVLPDVAGSGAGHNSNLN